MLRTKWQWWLAAGIALALLIVSPLAAQSPAPSAQTAGAVCPLSDEQTQKATQAFEQLAHTFTTEPRCVNCHGGVNPFGPEAETTHGGGELKKILMPASVTDKVLIALGIKTAVVDDEKTNEDQCQECHSLLPHWKLAPSSVPSDDTFKGKTAVQICKNQKFVFGKLLTSGPPGFADHIAHDVKNVPFIAHAFAGTRGLDEVGLSRRTGRVLEPITSVSHDQLNALAQQWADALGPKFQGDEECGCAPHHYALFVEEIENSNGPVSFHNSGQLQVPITFKDDGSFTGSENERRVTDWSVRLPKCTGSETETSQLAWSLSGSVEGSDPNTPGIMHIHVNMVFSDVSWTAIWQGNCSNGSSPGRLPSDTKWERSMPDIPAEVGKTSSFTVPLPGGSDDLKLTIRQID